MKRALTIGMVLFALTVIAIGAYTRLTDAGLGCPDWPGCYGQVLVPTSAEEVSAAQALYPDAPVEAEKAWTEMIHRYVATTLGALVLLLSLLTWMDKKSSPGQKKFCAVLLALVIFQGMLGMWTVTMKLFPLVVMSHLIGGITTLSLLWILWHKLSTADTRVHRDSPKPWVLISIGFLAVQIMLGGWTSANYASMSCLYFPYCNEVFLPQFDWQAFDLFGAMSVANPSQYMSLEARQTIHMIHRMGAIVVTGIILYLSYRVWSFQAKTHIRSMRVSLTNGIMVLLLGLQVILGITNVVAVLPLSVAVAHNFVAVLLLMSLIRMYHVLPKRV